jgi:LPS export ABC transporter protein LptC
MTLTKRLSKALLLSAAVLMFSCQDNTKPLAEMQVYEGPLMEGANVETLYSDSARIRVRLTAPKQLQFESGDQTFPEGIYIEFFNEEGVKSTTLKANQAKYSKNTDLYTATGDVVVINLLEKRQINSEELIWNKRTRKIYTERFVRIQTPEETLMGEGLTAAQDFSSYKITRPTGTFSIKDE